MLAHPLLMASSMIPSMWQFMLIGSYMVCPVVIWLQEIGSRGLGVLQCGPLMAVYWCHHMTAAAQQQPQGPLSLARELGLGVLVLDPVPVNMCDGCTVTQRAS